MEEQWRGWICEERFFQFNGLTQMVLADGMSYRNILLLNQQLIDREFSSHFIKMLTSRAFKSLQAFGLKEDLEVAIRTVSRRTAKVNGFLAAQTCFLSEESCFRLVLIVNVHLDPCSGSSKSRHFLMFESDLFHSQSIVSISDLISTLCASSSCDYF